MKECIVGWKICSAYDYELVGKEKIAKDWGGKHRKRKYEKEFGFVFSLIMRI